MPGEMKNENNDQEKSICFTNSPPESAAPTIQYMNNCERLALNDRISQLETRLKSGEFIIKSMLPGVHFHDRSMAILAAFNWLNPNEEDYDLSDYIKEIKDKNDL